MAPGQTPVQTCDPGGVYCASVTDGGALVTTATLTGSITVGAISGTVDAGVNVNNNPGVYLLDAGVNVLGPVQVFGTLDASVSVSNTVTVTGTVGTTIPATFATPSQWYGASAGTIKEAGAIVYTTAIRSVFLSL